MRGIFSAPICLVTQGIRSLKLQETFERNGFVGRIWLPIVLPALAFAVLGFHRRWVAEDAFITFRVVRHIVAGNGPVFNEGERVEASTSTLWTWLLAALSYITPFRLEWIAVIAGLLFTVLGVVMLTRFCMSLSAPPASTSKDRFIPLGLLVLIGLPPFWDYSTSGLESGLCVGWLGACALMLARQRLHASCRLATAALLGLGPLVRPEFALYSGVFLFTFLAIGNVPRKQLPRLMAAAVFAPVMYQIFRLGYYAALVPNTALAKEASRLVLDRGLAFSWDFFGSYWLLLPLGLIAIAITRAIQRSGDRSDRILLLALPVAGVLNLVYITAIGGDYMHGRLLLPGVVAIIAPVSVTLLNCSQPHRQVMQYASITALVLWACWSALFAHAAPEGANFFRFFDERAHMVAMTGKNHPVKIEDHTTSDSYKVAQQVLSDFGAAQDIVVVNVGFTRQRQEGKPGVGRVAVVGYIGVTGYALPLNVHIVDLLSLADPIGSRIALEKPGFAAGHEKSQPIEWVLARFAKQVDGESPQLQQARQRITCPRVISVLDATQQPLSLARFIANILMSPRLTSTRLGTSTELFSC